MQSARHDRSRCDPSPLRVESLSRSFGGLRAVDDVSFEVAVGERLAVLGPNGAGKSTLFNLVCGDIEADAGRVILAGDDVTALPLHRRVRRGLARTYQTSSVFDGLTVSEQLVLARRGTEAHRLSLWHSRAEQLQMRNAAEEFAEAVGLAHRSDDLAAMLSHGERRQLEVGMALAARPVVILLDEPAAGLSASERSLLTELLLGLDEHVALVLVEHDMEVALTVADRVIVLESGKMIASGTPDEIEADPLVRAVYLGEQHGTSTAPSSNSSGTDEI